MNTTARDPRNVPEAISVKLGELRFVLAAEANAMGIGLGELIRRRLLASIEEHPPAKQASGDGYTIQTEVDHNPGVGL